MNYFSLKQGLQILRVNSVASGSALVQRFVFVLWCLEICNKLPWLFFCWTISLSVMSILFLIFAYALRQFLKWSLNLVLLLIYIITFRITAVFHSEYRALVIQLIMLFVVVLASLFALIFIATCFIIFVHFLQSFHFSFLLEIQEDVLWSWTLMLLFAVILNFFLTSEYLWLLTLPPLWFDLELFHGGYSVKMVFILRSFRSRRVFPVDERWPGHIWHQLRSLILPIFMWWHCILPSLVYCWSALVYAFLTYTHGSTEAIRPHLSQFLMTALLLLWFKWDLNAALNSISCEKVVCFSELGLRTTRFKPFCIAENSCVRGDIAHRLWVKFWVLAVDYIGVVLTLLPHH